MHCEKTEEKLIELLYDEISDEQRQEIEHHLSECHSCSAEFESLRKTMKHLDQWVDIEEPFHPSPEMVIASSTYKLFTGRSSMFKSILTGSAAAIILFCMLELTNLRELFLGDAQTSSDDAQQATSPIQTGLEEFILLLFEDRNSSATLNPDEEQRLVQEYSQWAGQLAQNGQLVGAEKLKNEWSRVLTGVRDSFVLNEDFQTRENEMISGFFHIQVESYGEAIEIARQCPHLKYDGRIELRWIENIDQ